MSDGKTNIRVAERVVAILKAFSFVKPELSFTDIVNIVDLPKATVHRLIATLEDLKFLKQDPKTSLWRLSGELMRLGAVAQASNEIAQVSKYEMEQLVKRTEQTCNLYTLQGLERVCVAQVAGLQYMPRYSFLGATQPLYCGAGKLFLAFQSEKFLEQYFKLVSLQKLTENTTTSIPKLLEECEEIREKKWMYSLGERDPVTASVSAPIFDYTQHIVGVITISGPIQLFTQEHIHKYADEVRTVCLHISKDLGFDSNLPILF